MMGVINYTHTFRERKRSPHDNMCLGIPEIHIRASLSKFKASNT